MLLVTGEAVATATSVAESTTGRPEAQRLVLLDTIPGLINYYSDGSAALAADFYEEERDRAGVRGGFTPVLSGVDRTVKIRRATAWASEPWFIAEGAAGAAAATLIVNERITEVVQLEVARAYRDTITTNRRRDPEAVGWRRITAGGCKFCRMLADRGAVYKQSTARFAAHPHCHCSAEPVFTTNDTGVEASVMQYRASRRSRSPEERASLRAFLDAYY